MIKPANIILTLVSSAVVGGSVWNAARPPSRPDDDWGSSSKPSPRSGVAANPSYPNDYFVKGLGYYHAPYHAFYPLRYNYHDPAKGYYWGGLWNPSPSTSTVTSSTPTPEALAKLRELRASGTATEEYPNNTSVPGMGYYHAPYHSFHPFQFNAFDASRGYYYGGSWWPTASTSPIRSSTPSTSVMSQLRQAMTTGTMVSSSGGSTFHGSTVSSGSGSHVSSGSASVSRGGFGSTAHGSSSGS